MKAWFFLSALCFAVDAWAAVTAPPTRRTQNFIVQDLRGPAPASAILKTEEGKQMVKLDLDVLALSAERIKRALCAELDLAARGWGKIHLILVSATRTDQEIRFLAASFVDGWHYRVEIPDQLEDLKLVRGIVQALLLELANRGSGPKSAEIPVWLNEGLSLQLWNTMGPSLILQSVPSGWMLRSVRNVRGVDRLGEARSVLRSYAAATFVELGHPALETLNGDSLKRYQSSAQLFVEELCRLPNGRASLVNMLRELPTCWNWETALFRSFGQYFTRPLDVEKWWAVVLASFTGRDPTQVWPAEICFGKLDGILLMPVQVRLSRDVMPVLTYVTPQQIIADWDFASQKAALEQTLGQLGLLRFNCPLKVAALIERYRLTFQNYLQKKNEAKASSATKGLMMVSIPLLVRETIVRLDELYREREALRRDLASVAQNPAPQ